MMRVRRSAVLGLTLLMLLFACTGAFARTKVTVWLIGDPVSGGYGRVWEQIKDRIVDDLPHIEVDMHFGASPDQRYAVAVAGGIAPDIVTLSTAMAPQFIQAGMLSPIDYSAFGVEDDEGLKELFYPGALRSMYAFDDIYFMPVELTTFGMYYNIDLMEEMGLGANQVPQTWDEIIEYGRSFMRQTADGSSYETVGLAMNRGWIWPSFRWIALLRQNGIDWMMDGKPAFDRPEAVEAIELYTSLFHQNQVTTPTANNAFFLNGNAAFYLGPSYEVQRTIDQVGFRLGTSGYPSIDPNRRVSTSYAWGLYVSEGSPVKKEAWEVINYLTSEEYAPLWFSTSSLLIPRAGDWIFDVIDAQPQLAPFIMELEYAQMELAHPEYAQIRSAITAADNGVVALEQSVSNILATLNHQVSVLVNK